MSDQDPSEQQPLLPVNYGNARASGVLSTWRETVARVLESKLLHIFVLTLISIDAACVIADISYGFLLDGCTPEEGPDPVWLEVLDQISLAITTFFLVEIPFSLWAFGPKFYLPFYGVAHAPLHLFDAIIVVTTFVLEFVLKGKEREIVELLVILRLWRLVKLVGGIAVGAGEVEEQIQEELEDTKRQLEGCNAALAKAREENRKLRARVVWLETGGSEGSEL